MDTLPNEILEFIFRDLTFFQKQECMLVCRRWSDVIRFTSLFSTVDTDETTKPISLIRTLDINPSYRCQIQKLILRNSRSFDLSKNQALDYFPKLKSIHLKSPTMRFVTGRNSISESTDFNNWLNQIEVIEQPFSHRILSSGAFFGLKTLILTSSFHYFASDNITGYAPNISSLTIIGVMVQLAEFESLQNGLKNLQSLTLEKAYLLTDIELNGISTENTLATLSISFVNKNDDVIVVWLQYFTKKYSLLQHFKFVFPWTGQITLRHEENIINNGLVPLLKSLGSQLKHLDISCSDRIQTILLTLDVHNYNIEALRVNTLFSTARQSFRSLGAVSRYIHELTITLNTVFWLKAYNLGEIKTLKKLKIGRLNQGPKRHTRTSLGEILESCPNSLESLEIYDFYLNCFSNDFKFHSLKSLAIHSSIILQNAYKFISDSLPGVNCLIIDERCASNDDTIMLKDKDFFYLEVSMKGYDFISITTLSDGISYYYSLDGYQTSEFNSLECRNTISQSPIKRATLKQTKGSKIAKLTCNSVKTLVINKKTAF